MRLEGRREMSLRTYQPHCPRPRVALEILYLRGLQLRLESAEIFDDGFYRGLSGTNPCYLLHQGRLSRGYRARSEVSTGTYGRSAHSVDESWLRTTDSESRFHERDVAPEGTVVWTEVGDNRFWGHLTFREVLYL